MSNPTKRASEIAMALKYYFDGRKDDLGIVDVFYGDQVRIPNSPTLCIEPADTSRVLSGSGEATTNIFQISAILYDARLGDVEDIQYNLDRLAEDVAEDLNHLGQFDGLITYGFAGAIEFGYLIKSNRLLRADRIVWTAQTKTER